MGEQLSDPDTSSRRRPSALRRFSVVLMVLLFFAPYAWCGLPVLMVYGDSLSAAYGIDLDDGWVSRLQRRLVAKGHGYDVVNASISGDTTRSGLMRMDKALQVHIPAILILELGGNDGLRGVAPSETRGNLASMIEKARGAGAEVLLLGMRLPPNYGHAYTSRFEGIYSALAEHYGVPLVPFMLEGVAGHQALMQHDGVHPRAEGQERILDNVWPHLEPLLPTTDRSPLFLKL